MGITKDTVKQVGRKLVNLAEKCEGLEGSVDGFDSDKVIQYMDENPKVQDPMEAFQKMNPKWKPPEKITKENLGEKMAEGFEKAQKARGEEILPGLPK